MIGRVVLAALLAGIAAGLAMSVIQHVRLTPLILQAESFEQAGHSHSHDAPAEAEAGHSHDHDEEAWAPEDGWQRTLSTTVTAAMTGAGFAAILAAVSLIGGIPITRQNGLVWGISGFIAVTLAPAVGLPPELPGMPAGDLASRQFWWAGTIVATGAGLFLFATRRQLPAIVIALVLILLPHVLGPPAAINAESAVPPGLAAAFVANSLAANAIFWSLIGLFLGLVMDRTAKDVYAT